MTTTVLHEHRFPDGKVAIAVSQDRRDLAIARPVPGGAGGYIVRGNAMCWLNPRAKPNAFGITSHNLLWVKTAREARAILSGL